MPFRDYLTKVTDKIHDRLPPDIQQRLPPPIPFGSKPTAAAGSSAPLCTYWRADFAPHVPVTANFGHECGDWGWGNNELENYTDQPQNSFHTPSNCLIVKAIVDGRRTGSDRYTSARLTSHQRLSRRQGYLEATISAPSARGIWPAFWLLPADPFKWPEDGEVDIMESWNGARENHTCLHWGNYTPAELSKHRVMEQHISDVTRPHTYGFAWDTPPAGDGGRFVWYIDGKPVMKAHKPGGTRRIEDFRILLNVAIGGDVCSGQTPKDGSYEMCVHELKMCDSPVGGWEGFEREWHRTREGRPM